MIFDEDTGLYFYGSGYYDPELARFIQPDSIIPSSTTSQALNRYAYVRNNPLKFTDPTGHGFGKLTAGGWFSKFVKKWIGTIITVALNCMGVPYPIAAVIGSAVSTAVNGGTFASFAIGAGIGIAAGYIANAAGVSIFGKTDWGNFVGDPIGKFAYAALQGSISGAISSAVYGQDIWKGMGEGALSGVIGAGVALGTETAFAFGQSVIKDLSVYFESGYKNTPDVVIATSELGGPKLGETVDKVIDSAIMPWKLDPRTVEIWEQWKRESWTTHFSAIVVKPIVANAITLPYSYMVDKIATAVGNASMNLVIKHMGKEYWCAYLKIQKYEYARHFIFWRTWKTVGKPYFYEVKGSSGWESIHEAYRGIENAANAIDRVEWKFNYRY